MSPEVLVTIKVQEGDIIYSMLTEGSTALSVIENCFLMTYHLTAMAEMIWKEACKLKWFLSVVTYKERSM